jgi:hypothetical protein
MFGKKEALSKAAYKYGVLLFTKNTGLCQIAKYQR